MQSAADSITGKDVTTEQKMAQVIVSSLYMQMWMSTKESVMSFGFGDRSVDREGCWGSVIQRKCT